MPRCFLVLYFFCSFLFLGQCIQMRFLIKLGADPANLSLAHKQSTEEKNRYALAENRNECAQCTWFSVARLNEFGTFHESKGLLLSSPAVRTCIYNTTSRLHLQQGRATTSTARTSIKSRDNNRKRPPVRITRKLHFVAEGVDESRSIQNSIPSVLHRKPVGVSIAR